MASNLVTTQLLIPEGWRGIQEFAFLRHCQGLLLLPLIQPPCSEKGYRDQSSTEVIVCRHVL